MADPAIISPRGVARREPRSETGSASRGAPPTILAPPAATPPATAGAARTRRGRGPRLALGGIVLLAATTVGGHVATNLVTPYGVHRDELLYLAMGRHLRMWAMDFPPFVALMAELSRAVVDDSLVLLRLGPALAVAACVVLSALTARSLGGHRGAQLLAGLSIAASPVFLRAGNLFQPVAFDQLWWTLALFALVRIAREPAPPTDRRPHHGWADGRAHRAPAQSIDGRWHHPPPAPTLPTLLDRPAARWWVLLGAAGGFGLLTKFSIAFLAAGLLVGLLLSPLRRTLLGSGPWIALAVALVVGSPSLAGQIALDWPLLGQMRELQAAQLERVTPGAFLAGQLAVGPAVALALLGVWYLLVPAETRPVRALGWACVAAFAILLALQGKPYYAAPIYPALAAAGAVALERLTHRLGRVGRYAARGGVALACVVVGAVALPIALPLLPPPALARYIVAVGAGGATATNTGESLPIPQDFADMLGWPQLAAAVGRAHAALPDDQRDEVVVLAGNYGQAGALDFYRHRVGLPRAVSPAGSYWFFGPGDRPGTITLAVGIPEAELRRHFARVTPVERIAHDAIPWMVPEERAVTVWRCEEPVRPIQDVWPELRPYPRAG